MKFGYMHIVELISGNVIAIDAVDTDAIVLTYAGDDEKTATIVPSELNFTLIDKSATDGRYKFLTDHPDNYIVRLYDDQEELIWEGKLVAAEYEEPVDSMNIPVSFTAIDNIAGLKEKYFENYDRYITVKDLFVEIMNSTGFAYDIYFMPAIVNNSITWANIVVDLRHFKDESMYDILNQMLKAMLMRIYVERGVWMIEGWNRIQRIIFVYIWRPSGTVDYIIDYRRRNVTQFIYYETPAITVDYPYSLIRIFPEKRDYKIKGLDMCEYPYMFTHNIIDVISPFWYGNNVEVIVRNWKQNKYDKYHIFKFQTSYNESTYAFYNFYVKKGDKIKIASEIISNFNLDLIDPMRYKFKLNEIVLQANFETVENYIPNVVDRTRTIKFEDETATIEYEYVVEKNGYFQIYIYGITWLTIKKFDIKIELPDEDVKEENDTSGYDYEAEIEIFPDIRNLGKSLITENIRNYTNHQTVYVEIYSTRIINGDNYIFVNIKDAILIDRYRENLKWDGEDVIIKSVEYNYLGGEGIAIVTNNLNVTTANDLEVDVYMQDNTYSSRSSFNNWRDEYYGIGQYKYFELYVEIIKKLRLKEFYKLDINVSEIILYSDFIHFDYSGSRIFRPANLEINMLRDESHVYAYESAYDVDSASNHPPYIYAPSPVIINPTDTSFNLMANAIDVDGNVASVHWQEIVGDQADIDNPDEFSTNVDNANADYYKYKVTVADNDGLSATDELEVIRHRNFIFATEEISIEDVGQCDKRIIHRLMINPELLPGDIILLALKVSFPQAVLSSINIIKNGISVIWAGGYIIEDVIYMTYESTDEVVIELYYKDLQNNSGGCENHSETFKFEILEARMINGYGEFGNLPFVFEYTVN